MRLTANMRAHLAELQEIASKGNTGEAVWYAVGAGEQRTAEALASRGYLQREYSVGAAVPCYTLTQAGRAVQL